MNKSLALLLSFSLMCLHGMTQSRTAPDIEDRKKNQKTMAILPGLTPTGLTRKQQQRLKADQIMDTQDSLALSFQRTLYSWFTTKGYGNTLEIQDPVLTDSLLQAAGLSLKDVIYGKKDDMARTLGVDVVMFASLNSKNSTTNTMDHVELGPNTALLADPVAEIQSDVSLRSKNNYVTLTINLYDGQDGDHLWEYEGRTYGGKEKYPKLPIINELISAAYKFYPYIR